MAKTPATKPPFPRHVYVTWGDDGVGDDAFLVADDSIEGIDDGKLVGVYELRETQTMRVTRKLE